MTKNKTRQRCLVLSFARLHFCVLYRTLFLERMMLIDCSNMAFDQTEGVLVPHRVAWVKPCLHKMPQDCRYEIWNWR